MRRLWALVAMVVALVACGGGDDSSSGGDGTGGGVGGLLGDAASAFEAGMCVAPTQAGACGLCTKQNCCAEQLTCLTDSLCAYAGLAFIQCAQADGGPACYNPFTQTGGALAMKVVDCAKAYCKTPCEL